MKKLLNYIFILMFGLAIVFGTQSIAAAIDGQSAPDARYILGFVKKQTATHFIIKKDGRVYKENIEKWIREHRVPYPKVLDTFIPPNRDQITKHVMGHCNYKRLSYEDKLQVIEDIVNYWKIAIKRHQRMKKWEYWIHPTCGARMARLPDGRMLNTDMIELGIGIVRHKFKNGRTGGTMILTAPICKR